MNPQAALLNQAIADGHPALRSLLSKRGEGMFFPYAGILGQAAEAKSKRYSATVGIALEEDRSPMRLPLLEKMVGLSPKDIFPYAPSFGLPKLRKKWAEMIRGKNPSLGDAAISLPVVTQALTHGLSVAGTLFFNPGEELLVPDPYWDNYDLLFGEGMGVHLRTFPCFSEDGLNLPGFSKVLEERRGGKINLLLNFPNNPSGYTPTVDEMNRLAELIVAEAEKGSRFVVLIDDAYFGLVYQEGIEKESIFSILADAHEHILAVKIDGATKEDYVWGLRVGFLTYGIRGANEKVYKALADKTGGVIRGGISNCSMLSQSILLVAFESDEYEGQKMEKYRLLKSRYDEILKTFESHPEYAEMFKPLPFNSGYFMCVRPKETLDAEAIRVRLLEKYDTGVIHLQGLLRIAFSSLPKPDIPVVFKNLYEACKELDS